MSKPLTVFSALFAAGIAIILTQQSNGMPSPVGWTLLAVILAVLAWTFV